MIHGTNTDLANKYPLVVNEIDADDALIVLLRKPEDADKPPNEFDVHQLVLKSFRFDRPAAFHGLLTNPKPKGEIDCDAQFGPWNAEVPSQPPLSGTYTFHDVDLGTLKGLNGIRSSKEKYSGPLDYLNVEGTTDTPDFALRTSDHPVALHTDFVALVDGTNGNTALTSVTARFLHTVIEVQGAVVDLDPAVKGRTIILDATSNHARVEDLLALAVKSGRPVMTGAASLKTKILIPERDEDLVDRLQLEGQFGLGHVKFPNPATQERVDMLSRKGQGRPQDADISEEVSNFQGRFTVSNAEARFSDLEFAVEGASVSLAGAYNLDSGELDFRGHLETNAKLSQTMNGWKSVMRKPFDRFFRGPNGGAQIPIRITGTRRNPSFGTDFHDKDNPRREPPPAARLEVAAPLHGLEHGDLVGVLQIGTDRNTHGDARDADAQRFDQLRQVNRSGLAFGGRIGGHDNLFDGAAFEAFDETFDLQLIGADTFERRQSPAQHVIDAIELPRFLDRLDVGRVFHDANNVLVTRRARTEQAGIAIGNVVADRAFAHAFLGLADRVGEGQSLGTIHAKQVEGEALRRFLADPRQSFEFLD